MVPDKNSGNQGSEKPGDHILFAYLCNRQKQMSDDFNAMDQKFAQIIAFNGVILAVLIIGIDPAKAAHFPVCLGGIVIIFASAFLSGIVYSPKKYDDGLENFWTGWDESKDDPRGDIPRPNKLMRLFFPKKRNVNERQKFPVYSLDEIYRPEENNEVVPQPELGEIDTYNKLLLNSIINNSNLNDDKADIFGVVLLLLFVGLAFVILGYY